MAARASVEPRGAAPAAVSLLAAPIDSADADLLFEAFVGREGGDEALAAALDGQSIDAAVAAGGIRVAGSSGRQIDALVESLTRAGGLEPIGAMPPPDVLTSLVRAVAERGDAARGEAIFRRDSLRCTTCHAIGGAGGRVGPDLSSLGGSAQVVHLFESLLDPGAKIKEGFETVVVLDSKGTFHSGIAVHTREDELAIRDVKDRLLVIPKREIQAVSGGGVSLMPQGLMQSLRRDELVDLVRFLSELGRPGPYRLPVQPFVRSWRALDVSSGAEEIATRQEIDALSTTSAASWKTLYSKVDGSLPLAEIPMLASRRLSLVRFEVSADEPVVLYCDAPRGLTLRDGAHADRAWPRGGVALERGSHEVVLIVDRAIRDAALRIEVRETP